MSNNEEEYLDNLLKSVSGQNVAEGTAFDDAKNEAVSDKEDILLNLESTTLSEEEQKTSAEPEMVLEDVNLEELSLEELNTEDVKLEELSLEELNTEDVKLEELSLEELGTEELNLTETNPEELNTEELSLESEGVELNMDDDLNLEELNIDEIKLDESEEQPMLELTPNTDSEELDINLEELESLDLGDLGLSEFEDILSDDNKDTELVIDSDLSDDSDDSDLDEINALLKANSTMSSDSNDEDDMMELLNQMADDEAAFVNAETTDSKAAEINQNENDKKMSDSALTEEKKEAKVDIKKSKKKVKKQKQSDKKAAVISIDKEKSETSSEKKGIFAKLFDILTEDLVPEPTEEELAKEAQEKAAAKAEAKTKKEEEKAVKDEEKKAKAEEKEAAKKAKAEAAAQKKQEKQAAKEAKLAEKKAKQEEQKPGKKISPKKIAVVAVFAASVFAIVMVFSGFVSKEGMLQRARKAYYAGDYKTVYLELYGEKLESSDQLVRARSTTILTMQRKYDSYINNMKLGKPILALNALIEGLGTYDYINAQAQQYGCETEVKAIKDQIVDVLNTSYGLSEEMARELLQSEDDVQYTKALSDIINTKQTFAKNN